MIIIVKQYTKLLEGFFYKSNFKNLKLFKKIFICFKELGSLKIGKFKLIFSNN